MVTESNNSMAISRMYDYLLEEYGPQGWWPLLGYNGTNPTRTGTMKGYHPGDYTYPKTDEQLFEICVGCILVTHTAWANVEKALLYLQELTGFNPKILLDVNKTEIIQAIKPAGHYNNKARTLIDFTEFFISLNVKEPSRNELISVWGIGEETADTILLYAYKKPVFIVDAYTKKILLNLELINEKSQNQEIKELFENNLQPDFSLYQEYHALLVEHGKRYYTGKGKDCPLLEYLKQERLKNR